MLQNLKPFYATLLSPITNAFIKMGIHPNAITIAGLCISPVAAWMAAIGHWVLCALFIGIASIMDGLDGQVARKTEKKSPWGAILDSTVDRLTEIIWLAGLLVFYSKTSNGFIGIFFTFIAMSGSLMVSYVRARSEGAHIPCTSGIAQRPERIIVLMVCFLAGPTVMVWGLVILSIIAYVTVIQRLIETYRFSKKNAS